MMAPMAIQHNAHALLVQRENPDGAELGAKKHMKKKFSENEEDSRPELGESPFSATGLGLRRTRKLFFLPAGSSSVSTGSTLWSPTSSTSSIDPLPTECFSVDVRRATEGKPQAPAFHNKELRDVIEPHIAEARLRRDKSRQRPHLEVHTSIANAVGVPYTSLRSERPFLFDVHTHPIHQILAETLGVKDLSLLHECEIQDKRLLMSSLLNKHSRRRFQQCYDNFVTSFCIPLLHSFAMTKKIFQSLSTEASTKINYRYQAFPCIRIVRPGECSVGPDCDTAQGHSIGSLNFHVPLTAAYGTNALYTESHPGREDWHPLTTKAVGLGYLFDGARCLHFTTENTTPHTRVSIDFRIAIYSENYSDNGVDGGLCNYYMLEDQYSSAGPGYYDEATIDIGVGEDSFPRRFVAKKYGSYQLEPDSRVGFPFDKI